MKTLYLLMAAVMIYMLPISLNAQSIQPVDSEYVERAKDILATELFARLEAGETDELAEWVTDQTHSEVSGTTRVQSLNQFQSQFRMILTGEMDTPFGAIDGYDIIQVSTLPGTNRYFRLLYMSYHQRAPLLWEVHFYIKPNDELSITYFQFDGQNPFSYMTTSDMLIEQYYNSY